MTQSTRGQPDAARVRTNEGEREWDEEVVQRCGQHDVPCVCGQHDVSRVWAREGVLFGAAHNYCQQKKQNKNASLISNNRESAGSHAWSLDSLSSNDDGATQWGSTYVAIANDPRLCLEWLLQDRTSSVRDDTVVPLARVDVDVPKQPLALHRLWVHSVVLNIVTSEFRQGQFEHLPKCALAGSRWAHHDHLVVSRGFFLQAQGECEHILKR